MSQLSGESWLSQRLIEACGEGLFTGINDRIERQHRAEALILRYRLAQSKCACLDGKEVSFETMFRRIFRAQLRSIA